MIGSRDSFKVMNKFDTTNGHFSIQNPTNAFVIIKYGVHKIVIDPWVKSGIYDGGWNIVSELNNPASLISDATHLYITHIHEDHCDPAALRLLSKNIKAYIPEVFASNIIEKKLRQSGLENITYIKPYSEQKIEDDFSFEVIDSLNSYGQLEDLYQNNYNKSKVAIDTGLIIKIAGQKLVFLGDNTPYDQYEIEKCIGAIKNCDLLAFPYNGAASDYPICYSNISDQEMLDISNNRETKREVAILNFLNKVQPKLLMPYSSDFLIGAGQAAKRFYQILDSWWANKDRVKDRYQNKTGIPAVALGRDDLMLLDATTSRLIHKKINTQSLDIKKLQNEFINNPNRTDLLYQYSGESLTTLTKNASEHMFNFMKKLNLDSEWTFQIILNDTGEKFILDFNKKIEVATIDSSAKVLTVMLKAGYYEALLKCHAHWNNAQLSFQVEWQRVPNVFCNNLYTALNFFHIKRQIVKDESHAS